MKKNLLQLVSFLPLAILLLAQSTGNAQWCNVTTAIPYDANMPGITNVTVGNINRTSADLENYPNNSYVNTGLTLNLVRGNTYSMSITHTVDASICPDMNLRAYIDYNRDYQLDDPGETVVSTDHHLPGTFTSSFTVPMNAALGITRMRVLAKMSDLGGHTAPSPCDDPPDPFGMHGEVEDYNVSITAPTGIDEMTREVSLFSVYPAAIIDHTSILFNLSKPSSVTFRLYDAIGNVAWLKDTERLTEGIQEIKLEESVFSKTKPGVYFLEMMVENRRLMKKLVVL